MYRVELKVHKFRLLHNRHQVVPNVPCGVERSFLTPWDISEPKFLMYRVELKEVKDFGIQTDYQKFLMYRVELKGYTLYF